MIRGCGPSLRSGATRLGGMRPAFVKICGLVRAEDAEAAVRSGADAVGVVFAESPRRVGLREARAVAARVREEAARARRTVLVFGIFVNEAASAIRELAREVPLDVIQLHGDETLEDARKLAGFELARAVRLRGEESLREVEAVARSGLFEALFLDAFSPSARGGTGLAADWDLAARAVRIAAEAGTKTILAGGLCPGNVAEAIERVGPFGVDASSGLERSPGVKDAALVERFVSLAKTAMLRKNADVARSGTGLGQGKVRRPAPEGVRSRRPGGRAR